MITTMSKKRTRLVPSNIDRMSESDYSAWLESLSDTDYETLCERTFVSVEYTVSAISADGDIIDNIWYADALADAMKHFDREAAGGYDGECVALILEKRTHRRSVVDRGDIDSSEYETLKVHGDENALRAGGWASGSPR